MKATPLILLLRGELPTQETTYGHFYLLSADEDYPKNLLLLTTGNYPLSFSLATLHYSLATALLYVVINQFGDAVRGFYFYRSHAWR